MPSGFLNLEILDPEARWLAQIRKKMFNKLFAFVDG